MQLETEKYLKMADRFRKIFDYLEEHRNEDRDQLAINLERLVFNFEEQLRNRGIIDFPIIDSYDVWDDTNYAVNASNEIRELFNALKHSCVDHDIGSIEMYLNSIISKYETIASKVDYCLATKREMQRRRGIF